jgi:hypothetical protein
MDFSGFLSGLVAELIAGTIAGIVVLYAAYRFVEPRLGLLEQHRKREEEERQRIALRGAVLKALHRELESSAALLQRMMKYLPKEQYPYPGFDLTGWPLVTQIAAFTALQEETIMALTHTYNRMRAANDQLAFASDLNHGATAILVNHVAATASDAPLVQTAFDKFYDHRESVRLGLIERLKELKPHLDKCIDQVEAELGLEVTHSAEARHYEGDEHGYIG